MKEILRTSYYSLYRDDLGGLWLEVLCGELGLYEVCIKLLKDEEQSYKNDPMYLQRLAFNVAKNPKRYLDHKRREQSDPSEIDNCGAVE